MSSSKNTSFLICFFLLVSVLIDVSLAKQHQNKDHIDKLGIFELKNGNLSVKLTNWGATIISFILPDKTGKLDDVVLGYDSVDDYKIDKTYFGAIVGRVANRIAGAQFKLNGTTYKLDANGGKNMLHGGKKGFSDVIWTVRRHKPNGPSPSITFSYESRDGEEGFPGTLAVSVTYTLYEEKHFRVTMKAKALNKASPVNLAEHTYWNLGGHKSGNILSNEIQLFASHITPTNDELIPTGKIVPVQGTPYDFLKSRPVGSRIKQLPTGYDINYVLDETNQKGLKKVAVVYDRKSGRKMELLSNQPGVQFYTSGMLKDVKGKDGAIYGPHAALCLETQGFPDSVNHPNFPSVIVNPGEVYQHTMLYRFSTERGIHEAMFWHF